MLRLTCYCKNPGKIITHANYNITVRVVAYNEKNVNIYENTLQVHFSEQGSVLHSLTLWLIYSILRPNIEVNNDIDISQLFKKLKAVLKCKEVG